MLRARRNSSHSQSPSPPTTYPTGNIPHLTLGDALKVEAIADGCHWQMDSFDR